MHISGREGGGESVGGGLRGESIEIFIVIFLINIV